MAQIQELERKIEELRAMLSKQKSEDPLSVDFSAPQLASSYGRLAVPSFKTQKIVTPFQKHIFNLTSVDSGLKTTDLISMPDIISMTAGYRSAELLKLECVFVPNHGAIEHPFTVECLWTPQTVTLTAKEIPDTYGSQMFVIGGVSMPMPHAIVAANLKVINPRIKDSVNYNDTPRLYIRFIPNQKLRKTYMKTNSKGEEEFDDKKKQFKTCRVLLRGVVCLHSPTISPGGIEDES